MVVANSAPAAAAVVRAGAREPLLDLHYLNGAFSEYLLSPAASPRAAPTRSLTACPSSWRPSPSRSPASSTGSRSLGSSERRDRPLRQRPIGLLFVDCSPPPPLPSGGEHTRAGGPQPRRLDVGRALGAQATVSVGRDGGEAPRLCRRSRTGDGFDVAIEATGSPAAWEDALSSVRPGGTVQLFGGCPPGTNVPLDTHRLHYSEITVKSAYHHRPATFARALALLAGGTLHPRALLSAERPLEELEAALRSMRRREALKVVIRP